MTSLIGNARSEEKKAPPSPKNGNKEINLNREVKEKQSTEMESLQRIINQLTNEVIELKRNAKESSRKPFKLWKKKNHN